MFGELKYIIHTINEIALKNSYFQQVFQNIVSKWKEKWSADRLDTSGSSE